MNTARLRIGFAITTQFNQKINLINLNAIIKTHFSRTIILHYFRRYKRKISIQERKILDGEKNS
jgi:hypothetical protein